MPLLPVLPRSKRLFHSAEDEEQPVKEEPQSEDVKAEVEKQPQPIPEVSLLSRCPLSSCS